MKLTAHILTIHIFKVPNFRNFLDFFLLCDKANLNCLLNFLRIALCNCTLFCDLFEDFKNFAKIFILTD